MSKVTTDLSIIIPCFNSGHFISDAIESVKLYKGKYKYEIIIVDDGSTDDTTLNILNSFIFDSEIFVIKQENQGAAKARNLGCEVAKGDYFLFLDSDNKIEPSYIDKALHILEKDKKIAVVYSLPIFFGDSSREGFATKEFDILDLLQKNYIDMCSFVRRKAFEECGGFDESLPRLQDWELWLSIYEKNWHFKFIPEHLFFYRIHQDSISAKSLLLENKYRETSAFVVEKHAALYFNSYKQLYYNNYLYQRFFSRFMKIILWWNKIRRD